jgi:Ni/Fe-hydrogenase subunit HybB-like protein
MSAHLEATPVGGPILTRPFKWLLAVFGVWVFLLAWRFLAGLGATTALNDGYAWGIWIAFDVVTGTALGCGGYALAILVYILNKGAYHPLVRPAILTSALGYSMAGFAIVVDVGRYWWIYRIPIRFWQWNLNSALLEVALCVMAYIFVLWLELSPAFMEKWKVEAPLPILKSLSSALHPVINKLMIFIVALGLLLPTMHQSSLGAVMLLAGHKLHALWNTPFIPLLFLVSVIAMGYAVVVLEGSLASHYFKRKRETEMLGRLSGVMVVVLSVYLVLRFADLIWRGALGAAFTSGWMSVFFWIETALSVAPLVMLASKAGRLDPVVQFRAALFMLLGGTLYRFNSYLIGFDPGEGISYFPSVPEMFITIGIVALEIMLYIVIVKRFPILAGAPKKA